MSDHPPTLPIPVREPGRPPHRGSAPDTAPTPVVTVYQRQPDPMDLLLSIRSGKGRHVAPKRGLFGRAVTS